MTHDALFGSILILAAFALFAILVVAGALKLARADRARLPGALGRDDRWAELDEWEQHVASTPGLEAEADRAIEACDLGMWELEHDWPQAYRAEDGGVA